MTGCLVLTACSNSTTTTKESEKTENTGSKESTGTPSNLEAKINPNDLFLACKAHW